MKEALMTMHPFGKNYRRYALLRGKRSVLLKALLIYTAVGSLLIATLSTFLFTRFSANSIREINNVSTSSLKQSIVSFDKLWNDLYLFMNKEFNSDDVLAEGMSLKEYSPIESNKIQKELNKIVYANNALNSIYLYNENADVIFSNFGTSTTCANFYDSEITKLIRNHSFTISQISNCAILYRSLNYSYGSFNQSSKVITVVFSLDDCKTALVFNIDQSLIQDLVATPNSTVNQNLMVINRQGMVVSDSDQTKVYTNIADTGYAGKILGSPGKTDYFIDTVDGRKTLVTFSYWDKWDNLGWVFVNTADYNGLLGDLKQLQSSILLVTLLFILAGITAAAIFLSNLFRPFYRLIELLHTQSPYEETKMSDIEYLGSVYGDMAKVLENLKSYKNNSRPLLKQEFLNKLLHGDTPYSEDVARQAADLDIKLDCPQYRVVTFRMDKAPGVKPEDMALLKYISYGIVTEHFSSQGCEVVESGDDNISAILGSPACESVRMETISDVQEKCLKLLKLSFTAGIGTMGNGITGIQYSYRTAMEATAFRLVYGRGSVIDYAAEELARKQQYIYPIDMERTLLDAVKAADYERFSEALDAFIGSIEGYAYDEMLLALGQMSLILVRTLKSQLEVTHMQEAGIHADIRELDSVIRGSETMDDIRRWLLDYFSSCIEAIRTRKYNKYSDVINSIHKYIAENYNDSGLSVERIADFVSLSPNYMRILFKDHTGMSISHYLNELRFQKAAELLLGTSYPASRIAGMVGFQEGGYFYSAFKSTFGMSPDEYRKSKKSA
jgi:two-component system, response regulator YesN